MKLKKMLLNVSTAESFYLKMKKKRQKKRKKTALSV
jgi:hypothetical protein